LQPVCLSLRFSIC